MPEEKMARTIANLGAHLEGGLICEMNGVRGGERGFAVELWRDGDGDLVLRAYNEAGYNWTEIKLWDLLHWLENGPQLQPAAIRSSVRSA